MHVTPVEDVSHGWMACIHLDACIKLDVHGEDVMIYIQRLQEYIRVSLLTITYY
jgi:hypothetical protein